MSNANVEVEDEINGMRLKRYPSELLNKLITTNLSGSPNSDKQVGEGGYGKVYKAQLPDCDKQAAIKVLQSKDIVEERETFMAEVLTMSNTNHKNIIKLIGYCFEPNMKALVYEYMEMGSLDKLLYNKSDIKWETFYSIAIEIAEGLRYFHECSNEQIIHYDIKAANVVLDNNLSPKIIDFGLAKLIKRDVKEVNLTRTRGTGLYTAPELLSLMFGAKVTNKCDVFSFGMLLFEILGKRKVKQGEVFFPKQVWNSFHSKELKLLFDDIGITEENREKANILAKVALMCINDDPNERPSMEKVRLMLQRTIPVLEPSLPTKYWMIPTSSTTSVSSNRMSEDDTSGSSGSNISRIIQDGLEGTWENIIYLAGCYEGTCKNGLRHGQGKYTYTNGDVFVGEWKDGKEEGHGNFVRANGNKYIGEFKNGCAEGQGRYCSTCGDEYVGEYKNGLKEGQGKYTYTNGDVFVGEWKDGKEEGHGNFVQADGDVYIGEFKNGQKEGQGRFTRKNGDYYEGTYKNGLKEGHGKYVWANGNKYIGEFKNGGIEGQGRYCSTCGDEYVGEWKNGQKEGHGKLVQADGDVHIGEYKNGLQEGQGRFTRKNGDYYEGTYKNGLKEGHGKYVWANGDVYIGEFKNGQIEGQGRFTYRNGDYYEGTCKNGLREGHGKFVWASGQEHCGIWIKGVQQ